MEEQNQTPNAAGAQSSSQGDAQGSGPQRQAAANQQSSQELIDELTQLADKFATVAKSAWNSEQRKQVETDVRSGLNTMAASLEDGFKQVASSHEAKDFQAKASEVGEKVTSSKFFAELSGALTSGLRTLSDQLDKVAADMQAKNAANPGATPTPPPNSDAGDSDVHDIPIHKE